MGEPQLLSFYLVIIIAAGVTAQLLGKLLRLPSIVFLLAFGVLLGPEVAGAIQPDLFGPGLQIMITLTVVIVLFEGSMNLHVREILHVHKSVRGLVTIGFAVTWGSATLLLHFLMGVAWAPAALFGALVSSTGPTVIKPLMQVIPVRREIRTILDAEGILADPISILAAVLCLEIAVAGGFHLEKIGAAIGIGAVVGGGIGWTLGYLIPARLGRVEALKNLLVLSLVFVAYGVAEAFVHEAGVVAVIAAGLAIQHGVRPHQHELRDFHEQISTLLLSVLFIVLAAGLRLNVMMGVGWKGLAVVLVLMFIVRPLNIFMSTRGGKAKLREKIFMSWTCPRGIVAAAVASLAALELRDAGMDEAGLTVQAMVFLTIFLTVFGQGLTAKPLAWLLRIHAADDGDVIVVGASPLARALARPFRDANRRVVMLDLNPRRVDVAKSEGFEILCEDGSNRDALKEAGIEEADTMIAATENSHVNVVAAQLGKREFNLKNVAVLLDEKEFSEMDPVLERAGVWLATGRPTNQQIWNRDLAEHKARIEEVTVTEHNRPAEKLADVNFHSSVLPLSVVRKGQVLICTQSMTLEEGDRIWLAVRGVEREVLQRDLGMAHPEQ